MTEIKIITPPVASLPLDHILVTITEEISKHTPEEVAHGCLGGSHGYGAHYSSAVFDMRPFYWGDCDCGADDTDDEEHKATCSVALPNFFYKKTGFEVRWYKWIGRSMETTGTPPSNLSEMLNECLADIRSPSTAQR